MVEAAAFLSVSQPTRSSAPSNTPNPIKADQERPPNEENCWKVQFDRRYSRFLCISFSGNMPLFCQHVLFAPFHVP